MESKIIEKRIKFNNKEWLAKFKQDSPYIKVFLYDENNNNKTFINDFWVEGDTIIDVFKNAVLQANKINIKCHEYEDFIKWDGNMDKELNIR